MARPIDFKRIAKEDFNSDERGLVEKLALPINSFFEQVRNALNNDIDFQNLNQKTIALKVRVDANGIPVVLTKFKSDINGRALGIICINAVNNTNPTNYPTGTPWINYTENSSLITVNNITNLVQNDVYTLTLLIIGD
jgi:hypothetical protein